MKSEKHGVVISFPSREEEEKRTIDNNNKHGLDQIIQLPTELVNYRNKNFFAAVVLLLSGVVIALYVRDYAPIILFLLFSAFFLWRGILVKWKYLAGSIAEIVATCTGTKPSSFQDRMTVTFTAEGEAGEYSYYKFVIPSKKKAETEFIVGARYVIYFDRMMKQALLGYVQVSAATF